jgi:methylthioribose-1-phosphate isomerase
MIHKTVDWEEGRVVLIDQTALPHEYKRVWLSDYREVAEAIRTMIVRGAPAIGVTAALGVALGAQEAPEIGWVAFRTYLEEIGRVLKATRPTAVNLFWAVDRMLSVADKNRALGIEATKKALIAEGLAMIQEDIARNRAMGAFGASLIQDGDSCLTHCNAGALATVDYGTALAVFRAAKEQGKQIHVYSDETRPRLQGMKLTAWELHQEEIPVTILCDNMAGWMMRQGKIQRIFVGADRIASNGDTANKIGTYSVAVLARYHGIPFYVVAPTSTIDLSLISGEKIPIENRSSSEVTEIDHHWIAPQGVDALNPSFDVTPAELISGIITENGIAYPSYKDSLSKLTNSRE